MELAEAEPKGDLSRWDTKKAAAISSSQSVFRFPGTPGCCGHQPSNATKKTVLSASLMLHFGWPITCICCFSHSISVPCAEGVLSFERTAWWNDCLSIMNRTRRCFRKHITNGIIISPIDCLRKKFKNVGNPTKMKQQKVVLDHLIDPKMLCWNYLVSEHNRNHTDQLHQCHAWSF